MVAIGLALPPAAAGDPAPESINGSGVVASTQFSVTVNGGPFGQDPSGSLVLQGYFTFTATPTCMNIAGNAGTAGFRIDNGAMEGRGFLAASEPDASGRTVQYSAVLNAPPTACPPEDAPAPPDAIENGGGGTVVNGQITDAGGPANPLPLSRKQFSTSAASTGARSIAKAPDGRVWFTEPSLNRVVSISDDAVGTMSEYEVPTADAGLSSIAPDLSDCSPGGGCADRGMWFSESNVDRVAHVSPNGSIFEYPLPTTGARPSAIAGDPAGGGWFTEPGADRIGRVSESGQISEYRLPTLAADPIAITAGGDTNDPTAGGVWFAEKAAKQIGHIDSSRKVSEYPLPAGAGAPTAISADVRGGAAGAWFLEPSANTVGHIDAYGDIDQYRIPTANASAQGLASAAGPDGSSNGAWFSETSTDQLGFISSNGQFSEFTIPGANPGAVAFTPSIDVPPTDGYSKYEAVWWSDPAAPRVGFATFPLNVSSGLPLVPPPPAPSYARLSTARRITVRGSRIRLTLRCDGGAGQCRGSVSVADASPQAASVTAPLAHASFSIFAHHSRTLVLKVDRKALRLLHTHRRGIPVTVNISSPARFTASTRTATLQLR